MKIQKFIFSVVVACIVLVSCKNEVKTETPVIAKGVKVEQIAMNISGMTCEIGCAKTIQSKLAKKEGVIDAKVIFTDSIATVKFDANKTNKVDLLAFVHGIAGGDLYKASENIEHKMCDVDCKKACCTKTKIEKKACAENCKKECCKDKKA